jgi:uridine kinase
VRSPDHEHGERAILDTTSPAASAILRLASVFVPAAKLRAGTSASGPIILAIAGHGAAGKTTLARRIADLAPPELGPIAHVATDEFWTGAGFALERALTEVLEPLRRSEVARFSSFDWASQSPAGERVLASPNLVVFEGVCALHQMYRSVLDIRVWIDTPLDVRLARAVQRDGEGARARWTEVWIPNEEAYVARDRPRACADVIVDGMSGSVQLPRRANS